MSLALADFKALLPISSGVEAWQLSPHIEQARLLDVLPLVGADQLERCEGLPALGLVLSWPVDLPTVQANAYVVRQERVFQALQDAPESEPPVTAVSTSAWSYDPLATLWHLYLKPYWVQAAFSRFALFHGKNFTKSGVTMPTDPDGSYMPATSAARAELQASVDSTAAALRNRLTRFLAAAYPRPAEHCGTHHTRRRRGLRGV